MVPDFLGHPVSITKVYYADPAEAGITVEKKTG